MPSLFLNGTAPLNTTGAIASCIFELHQPVLDSKSVFDQANCTVAQGSDRDSFLWYDELHPSEQTSRLVARAISNLFQGTSTMWTTFYQGVK